MPMVSDPDRTPVDPYVSALAAADNSIMAETARLTATILRNVVMG
jgi:hypothetical protein